MDQQNKGRVDRSKSLVDCLTLYANLFHKSCDADAILADLPVSPEDTLPDLMAHANIETLFIRAAHRAGLTAKLIHRKLKKISPLVLPVILLLEKEQCCILVSIDLKKSEAKILTPDMGKTEQRVDLQTLNEEYLGHAFFLKKTNRFRRQEPTLERDSKPGHWFWKTLFISKSIYFDVIWASLAINIFALAGPLFTMNVYDRVVPNNAVETLWALAMGVIVVYLFDAVLKFTRTYFLEIAAKKSDILLSSRIFSHVMGLKMMFRPKSVGSFASNLKEFDSIRNFLTSSTISTIIDLPFVIFFLLIIAFIGGKLIVMIPICLACMIIIYTLIIRNSLYKSIEDTYEAASNKNSILIESLGGMETLKTLGALGQVQYKWEDATSEIAEKGLKSRILSVSISTVTSLLVQLNTVFIIILGVYLIQDLQLTMGGLIAIVILSSRVIAPMGQVASLLANFEQTKVAYHTLREIMAKELERPLSKTFLHKETWQGTIEFKNVSFTYPETQRPVLNNVSFTLNVRDKVAVLGRMGAGKSTLEKLILGLYSPDSGSILVDGLDINQLDPHALRKKISYVPQDILLFTGTLKENILMATPDATDETLLAAVNLAGLSPFIAGNPQGFHMRVDEGGRNFSGGQRQGVGLARAFLSDTPMALLDEPTSSMDTATEVHVKQQLQEITRDKTTLLITHKTAMLTLVDRVLVLDDGKLAYDGSKEAFLNQFVPSHKSGADHDH